MATINQEVPVGKLEYVQRWVEAHEVYFDYYTHHARAMALIEAEENNSPQSSSMQKVINNEVYKYFPQCTNQAKDIGSIGAHNKNVPQLGSVLTVSSYEKFLEKYSHRASRNAKLMSNVEAHVSNLPSLVPNRVETDDHCSRQPAVVTRVSTNTFERSPDEYYYSAPTPRPLNNTKLPYVLPSTPTMSPKVYASRSAVSGAVVAARERQDDLRRPALENSGAAAERDNLRHRPKRP